MKKIQKLLVSTLPAVGLILMIASTASAQCPSGGATSGCAPTGAIFNLATAHPLAFNGEVYSQFTTSFVATASTQFISFAFREVPAYFSFDDVVVSQQGSTTNLLNDGNFEANTPANVATNFPVGWSRWIQAVDTSAIGEVASNTNTYGCDTGAHTGTYFWCDGSVEGYDALYQQLNGLSVGATYNVSFWLTDNSEEAMQGDPSDSINMLVYAGPSLPNGAVPIGPTAPSTPIPNTIWLLTAGLLSLGLYQWIRVRRGAAGGLANTGRFVALLCICTMVGLAGFDAPAEGKWSVMGSGSGKTAPKQLSLHVNGKLLTGSIDGTAITKGGADRNYFWFQAMRNGVMTQYKGVVQDGKIKLRETSPQVHRVLMLAQNR